MSTFKRLHSTSLNESIKLLYKKLRKKKNLNHLVQKY